jgi:hypothetical protein
MTIDRGYAKRRAQTKARYQALADQGMTITEAARHLGITKQGAIDAAKRLGVSFDRKPAPVPLEERVARDLHTLTTAGKYSHDEALAIINRPKRKLTWRAPEC